MGRPPSNGGPSFRFNQAEIAEMEAILQAHKIAMPERQVLVSLAEKFSNSEERSGKIEVQMKQVWNWFQNRRYAIRAKAAKSPGKLNITQMARDDSGMVKSVPQATQPHAATSATVRSLPQVPQHQHPTVPSASVRTFPQAPQPPPGFPAQSAARMTDNSQMEYEAKSARDGAWYDVSTFLSHRALETGDPEVLVRFAGFGAEEDEWVNIRKNVRQRSLPCESSECVAVLPADLILCFQEGKEQALYFDAHVLDAQRRRHDVRGCRCRFLVRYDHDQSEEIVALRKICRRPETDYRLQQLHAVNESLSANQNKNGATNNIHTVSTLRVYPPAEVQPKQHKVEPPSPAEAPQKRQRLDSPVPAPRPEASQMQLKVEAVPFNVPQNQQSVQPPMPAPSPLVDSQKVKPVVPSPSTGEAKQEVQTAQTTVVVPPSTEISPALVASSVERQKEDVVSGSSVGVQAELHEVQPPVPDQFHASALETKIEEPVVPVFANDSNVMETKTEESMVAVSTNDPNVAEEVKSEEPMVPVSANDPKTEEPVVPVSANDSKTEEPVVPVSANDPKTEEPVVPVSANDPNIEEPVVPVSANDHKTEEPVLPVSADDPKTEEPVVPISTNDAKTEEPVLPVSANDPKIEEPLVPISTNDAKTEEPVVPVTTNDRNVVEEAIETKTEEPVLTNDPNVTGAEPMLTDSNENMPATVEENVNDDEKVENSNIEPENVAVAMEEG